MLSRSLVMRISQGNNPWGRLIVILTEEGILFLGKHSKEKPYLYQNKRWGGELEFHTISILVSEI